LTNVIADIARELNARRSVCRSCGRHRYLAFGGRL